jgi:hypothetical protein
MRCSTLSHVFIFLLLVLMGSCSAALYIPRYEMSFLDFYAGVGDRTYTLQNNALQTINCPISDFTIGISLNPFYPFAPKDHLSIFDYLDMKLNVDYAFKSNATIFTETQGTEGQFSGIFTPSAINTSFSFGYNVLSFMDLYGGVGLDFMDNKILYKQTINGYTGDSIPVSHQGTSFFFDFGASAFLPAHPSLLLSFRCRSENQSLSYLDNVSGTAINKSYRTTVSFSNLKMSGVLTWSILRAKNRLIDQQQAAEDAFRECSTPVISSSTLSLKELTAAHQNLISRYNALIIKGKFHKIYMEGLDSSESKLIAKSKDIVKEANAASDSGNFNEALQIISLNLLSFHQSVLPSVEELISRLWTTHYSKLDPVQIDLFSRSIPQSPYSAIAAAHLDTLFLMESRNAIGLKSRLALFSRFAHIFKIQGKLNSYALDTIAADFQYVTSQNDLQKYEAFISGYSALQNSSLTSYLYNATTELNKIKYRNWKEKYAHEIGHLSEIEGQLSANTSRIATLKSTYQTYHIFGEIKDKSESVATLWGVAIPDAGFGGYSPGALYDKGNIIVSGIDAHGYRGMNTYEGHHCFASKTTSKGRFGQTVPVFIFGPCDGDSEIKSLEQKNHEFSSKIAEIKKSIGYDDIVKPGEK